MLIRFFGMLVFSPIRVQMTKLTLLKTPFWNIFNRERKTRVETTQIWQTFADFSIPFFRNETLLKVSYSLPPCSTARARMRARTALLDSYWTAICSKSF